MKLKELIPQIFSKEKIKKELANRRKRLILILTIFFLVVFFSLIIVCPIIAYQALYKEKIYSGVYIDGVNLGGLTQTQAIERLNKQIDNLKDNGLNFFYQAKKQRVEMTTVSPTDPDLSYQLLNFEPELMAEGAFAFGRDKDWFNNLQGQILAVLRQQEIPLIYTLKEAELKDILKQNFKEFENPGQDAQIVFNPDNTIAISSEARGSVIDYSQSIIDLKKNINLISINSVELKMIPAVPQVTQKEGEALLPEIGQILKQEKLVFTYKDKKWEILNEEFKKWLGFVKDNGQIKLAFKPELIEPKLLSLAGEINIAAQDAKFAMADGKVTEFQPGISGLELDLENSLAKINNEFFTNKNNQIELLVKESAPVIKTEDVNSLGIKDLIGTGVSDFAGSHVNRIKNIKNAVAHLNGIIIPPDEFSIVEAIGEVNAATGYFQEFVIKGDRTVPEYGGGLCQIGTTVFRAALYSGLPITERRPHSYIVSYYKPLGMDATIYGPHPDVRFLNDTGHNILLQIKIEGTKLSFEFWGTSDGRKIEITDPVLYNWTAQPADRLIENAKLKPGEKRLAETGRRGADAYFYRHITKANGEKIDETFRSHYVPWPNIYEIGLQPAPPQPAPDSAATSSVGGESGSTGNQNINSQ
ncbi:MAG: VanW family protein [Patescibacteria group bacterium]